MRMKVCCCVRTFLALDGTDVTLEEGDELISTELTERERLMERLELKKKKPTYNAYEVEEGGEKRLLAHYDDEEEKDRLKKRFVLDGTGNLADNETYRQEVVEKLRTRGITLDMPSKHIPSPLSCLAANVHCKSRSHL